jgi:hypothetical protein
MSCLCHNRIEVALIEVTVPSLHFNIKKKKLISIKRKKKKKKKQKSILLFLKLIFFILKRGTVNVRSLSILVVISTSYSQKFPTHSLKHHTNAEKEVVG